MWFLFFERLAVGNKIRFGYESASAELVFVEQDLAILQHVFAKELRRGHATEVLKEITSYADQNGITILLSVKRYKYSGDLGMTNNQLIDFYQKHGFRIHPEADTRHLRKMIREPSR